MRYFKTFEEFSNDFSSKYPKNKWIELKNKGELEVIKNELFVLVQNSYAPLGGHPSIPEPDSVIKLDYWEAIDNDNEDGVDAIIFGKQRHGFKISGIGHDNTKNGKREVIGKLANQLNKKSYWIEASDRLEEILYEKDVPYIMDIETVKKLFKTDNIEWLNDRGKYRREVHVNKYSIETVFGKPKI